MGITRTVEETAAGTSSQGSGATAGSHPGRRPGAPSDSGTRRTALRPFHGTPRFQPRALLGRGGMGVVYRVFDVEMGRDVALKTLPELSADEIVLLKEEFRAVAGVTHPNLIELFELVVDDDEAFFTMELLDGHDVVEHVRGRPRHEEGRGAPPREGWLARLTTALAQLASAVSALHRSGKLHRDIKPSNVWVTESGRLVLLDFGLATTMATAAEDESGAGTFEYMAPEQIWRTPLSPATDWYAVGEVLYEALTGVRAFGRTIDAKSTLAIPSPAQRWAGVPPELDALVMALLRPEAHARATAEDIARTLRGLGIDDEDDASVVGDGPFVGREQELATLRSAFAERTPGAPVLVRVEGTSGLGKTELLRRFTAELESVHGALVLRGRCHPQESVPYKAFDGLVDALSRALAKLPRERVLGVMPRSAAALLRVFPALAAVGALAEARGDLTALEPQEVRRRGFEALGELLSAIARERPLALWIDDLQWCDADSGLLLRDLLLGVTEPVLFLLAYRSDDLAQSPILGDVGHAAALLPATASHALRLAPLGDAASRALAAGVLGRHLAGEHAAIAAIVDEAAGSPFFIGELARHAARATGDDDVPAIQGGRLSRLLHDRLERLQPGERRVLELVATAGGPLDRSVALAAAGLGESGRPDVARLGRACLLRVAQTGERPTVETYHDRIREALIAALSPERRSACHRDLAGALRASPDPDPEALFRHYLEAGDGREAARFVVPAADRAAAALAFERAAELYRRALELGAEAVPRWVLHERRAEALAGAGRGVEAAESYEAAAKGGDGRAALDLERKAAEQLLRSGYNDAGTRTMGAVLARVGVRMPETPAQAKRAVLARRARLLFRGLRFARRDARDVAPGALARLDALWSASTSLSMMNHTVADALGVQHLLEALDLGERSRVARALGYEASFEAAIGGGLFRRRSERMLETVQALARETGSAYDLAWSHMAIGTSAWLRASWARTVHHCDRSAEIYREHCRGVAWELAVANLYALSALSQVGHMRRLGDRLTAALRDACDRGDLFAANNYRIGQMSVVWLARDQVEHCLALAHEAEASWRAENYHTQRYHHLIGTAQAALYAGDAWGAFERVTREWPKLEAAQFLFLECPRVELHHLRARTALAAAASRSRGLPTGATAPDASFSNARLVALALDDARRIDRDDLPIVKPFASLIRAGAASLRGDVEGAARALSDAAAAFDRAGMEMYREAARMRQGAIVGGDAGRRLLLASRRWMDQEGIVKQENMLELLTPACGPRA